MVQSDLEKIKAFKRKCEKVAETLGLDEPEFYLSDDEDAYEDDGTLHVCHDGIRACFHVSNGQELSGKEQNDNTRAVLEALKMKKRIVGRVLVEEADDIDERYCEACGHNCWC